MPDNLNTVRTYDDELPVSKLGVKPTATAGNDELTAEEKVRLMKLIFAFTFKWGWRFFVTLSSCCTVRTLMQSQGYRVSFSNVLLAAACTILTMRAWMPQVQPTE